MKKFTVVGYHEDNNQVWVEHVFSRDAESSVVVATHRITKRNNIPAEDFLDYAKGIIVVDVFGGHPHGLLESASTFSAYDHPEVLPS